MRTWIEDAETRRVATQAVAGLGAVAVIAVGTPAVERAVEDKRDRNEWRLKARAFVEVDEAASAKLAAPIAAARGLAPREQADRLAMASFESFAPTHFEHADRQSQDHECLSRAIYYEAGNEPVRGQIGVAEVVLNRVRHRLYPNTVCDVVYEGSERRTGCQFTFTCDGAEARAPQGRSWTRARIVAAHALMGLSRPVTSQATHYHANYVDPYWAPSLVHTRTIGTHIFYRFPTSKERRARRA
ncbi:MAG: cell wall hydrolase [Caulobacterales bacterium]|nr:cell wall hydrolase [Caulobacterales bacterium]